VIEENALIHRLDELRADFAEGQRALRELDVRRDELTADLLRVSGAVLALEELLAGVKEPEPVAT
jgi:predicted nuclease with TOPRIM domain